MATILQQGVVCDGYDVRCLLASGEKLTWHFLSQPANVQQAVDVLEAAYAATVEPEGGLEIVEE